jgi:hypothetical protein
MEADWEVEIGPGAPVIEACWAGFVDLRANGSRATLLPETAQLPGLADALVRLNRSSSPMWTSKCDVWAADEFDPDELDAPRESCKHAAACYIDLLPRGDQRWISPEMAIAASKTLCERLRVIPLRSCRADLILRRALIAPDLDDSGITAYITACGRSAEEALGQLGLALAVFAGAVAPEALPQ